MAARRRRAARAQKTRKCRFTRNRFIVRHAPRAQCGAQAAHHTHARARGRSVWRSHTHTWQSRVLDSVEDCTGRHKQPPCTGVRGAHTVAWRCAQTRRAAGARAQAQHERESDGRYRAHSPRDPGRRGGPVRLAERGRSRRARVVVVSFLLGREGSTQQKSASGPTQPLGSSVGAISAERARAAREHARRSSSGSPRGGGTEYSRSCHCEALPVGVVATCQGARASHKMQEHRARLADVAACARDHMTRARLPAPARAITCTSLTMRRRRRVGGRWQRRWQKRWQRRWQVARTKESLNLS